MPQTPKQTTQWPRIAVFGAGAVGCYFGARLAEAGAPVTLIGRPAHVQAIRANGLLFESGGAQRAIAVAADTDPAAVADAQIVLLCVKTLDTEAAARELAPRLAPAATLVSLQNGVDNVERVRAAAGIDALAAVVYVGASMPAPGHLRHAGRGELVLGEYPIGDAAPAAAPAASTRAERLAQVFSRAAISCTVSADIRVPLWTKLVMNCAFNAASALTRAQYGRLVDDAAIRALMRDVIDECIAVAAADGVALDGADALHADALALGRAMASATSSTSQDIERGRATEIDSLNGYVARRGRARDVRTPVNSALHALVRLRERSGAAIS